MDRRNFNQVDGPKIPPWENLRKKEERNQPFNTMYLDDQMRELVKGAIREVCSFRGYLLHALAVRTNHSHAVVGSVEKPEKIMTEFKAYSTRRLRIKKLIGAERRVWARHGSTRYLWKPGDIAGAVDHVLYGQGDDIPDFGSTHGF